MGRAVLFLGCISCALFASSVGQGLFPTQLPPGSPKVFSPPPPSPISSPQAVIWPPPPSPQARISPPMPIDTSPPSPVPSPTINPTSPVLPVSPGPDPSSPVLPGSPGPSSPAPGVSPSVLPPDVVPPSNDDDNATLAVDSENWPPAPALEKGSEPPLVQVTTWQQIVNQVSSDVKAGRSVDITLPGVTFYVTETLEADFRQWSFQGAISIRGQGKGKTILDCRMQRHAISILGAASVTLSDMTIQYCGSLKGGGASIEVGAPVVIKNVIFQYNFGDRTAGSTGGGLYLKPAAKAPTQPVPVYVLSCTFRNNTATYGAGLFVLSGTIDLFVDSSTFQENYAGSSGAGMYLRSMSGRATISASIFAQNKVVLKSGSGAGIVIDTPRAPVSITGCSFHRNEVPTALPGAYGAAVYVESVASTSAVTISDSSFTYNKARFGGAIGQSRNAGGLTITGSTLSGNTALELGGAVYVKDNTGAVNLRRSTLSFNKAGASGGAVMSINVGSVAIDECGLQFNKADKSGGALVLAWENKASKVLIRYSTFMSNTAKDNGGGVWVSRCSRCNMDIYTNTFTSNRAKSGGAVKFSDVSNSLVILSNMNYISNVADASGGGLVLFNSPTSAFRIRSNNFLSNYATQSCKHIQLSKNAIRLVSFGGTLYQPLDLSLALCLYGVTLGPPMPVGSTPPSPPVDTQPDDTPAGPPEDDTVSAPPVPKPEVPE